MTTTTIDTARAIIAEARAKGAKSLSEYDSKQVLAAHGVPVTTEQTAQTAAEAVEAAAAIGYPVAVKGNAADLAHKTEAGLVAGMADGVRGAETKGCEGSAKADHGVGASSVRPGEASATTDHCSVCSAFDSATSARSADRAGCEESGSGAHRSGGSDGC